MKTINLKQKLNKQYLPDVIILFNPSKDDIVRMTQQYPQKFILPFFDSEINDLEDMSDLPNSHDIFQPIYIGNLTEEDKIKVVTQTLQYILTPIMDTSITFLDLKK